MHTKTDKKLDELYKQLTEQEFTEQLYTPSEILVDLALIKDIYLGCYLSFLMELHNRKELYTQMMQVMPNYHDRFSRDITKVLPDLGIKYSALKDRLYRNDQASHIFRMAPTTMFIQTLSNNLSINSNHSRVIEKTTPITLHINTYPLKDIHKDQLDIMSAYLSNRLVVDVKFVYYDYTTIDIKDIEKYDEMWLYYFPELTRSKSVNNAFANMKLLHKYIKVASILRDDVLLPQDNRESIDKEIANLDIYFNSLCRFQMLPNISYMPLMLSKKEVETDSKSDVVAL